MKIGNGRNREGSFSYGKIAQNMAAPSLLHTKHQKLSKFSPLLRGTASRGNCFSKPWVSVCTSGQVRETSGNDFTTHSKDHSQCTWIEK